MRRNTLLLAIRLLVALNFLPAIFFKFAGVPLSVALFTAMSNAVHGLVSQPVFRLGSGTIETVLVLLFLLPAIIRCPLDISPDRAILYELGTVPTGCGSFFAFGPHFSP